MNTAGSTRAIHHLVFPTSQYDWPDHDPYDSGIVLTQQSRQLRDFTKLCKVLPLDTQEVQASKTWASAWEHSRFLRLYVDNIIVYNDRLIACDLASSASSALNALSIGFVHRCRLGTSFRCYFLSRLSSWMHKNIYLGALDATRSKIWTPRAFALLTRLSSKMWFVIRASDAFKSHLTMQRAWDVLIEYVWQCALCAVHSSPPYVVRVIP